MLQFIYINSSNTVTFTFGINLKLLQILCKVIVRTNMWITALLDKWTN
jgi:hypothetical protein